MSDICNDFSTGIHKSETQKKKKKKNNADNLLVARNDSNPMPQFVENDYDFPRSTLKKFHATFAICQRHIVKESKNVRPDTRWKFSNLRGAAQSARFRSVCANQNQSRSFTWIVWGTKKDRTFICL